MKIRPFSLLVSALLLVQVLVPFSANAAVTWYQESKLDVAYDGTRYNAQYDLQHVSAYLFDDEVDSIYFYLDLLQVPRITMFNDGLDSFAYVGLDYDKDDQDEYRLYTPDVNLRSDRKTVEEYAYFYSGGTFKASKCSVGVFTDIDGGAKWVGFKVSRSCIGLPKTFDLYGYAEYNDRGNVGSYDFAPYPSLAVTLPNSTSSSSGSSSTSSSGASYALPSTKANESTSSSNFSEAPSDLAKLSEDLLPSVVTVKCLDGSGTGWSAESALSDQMKSLGFSSIVFTNHHVVENCLVNKNVTLLLSNGSTVAGTIFAWNESSDVAGIATKTSIPALQWIGSRPRQGWWVGVLGSPLGKTGILTTGIVSSINSISNTFTFTAAINPGNSGGPVFDSTGRVLGLATSKNLISSDVIAEGFGNAHGTPLLCSRVISCVVEKDPWGATSKFKGASSASELTAAAQAKAAAEAAAKIAQDKAVAEAKAAAEAAAKMAADTISRLQNDFSLLSTNFNATLTKYNDALSQLESLKATIRTLENQIAELSKPKETSIVCTKGNTFKIVKKINPTCPRGYVKR